MKKRYVLYVKLADLDRDDEAPMLLKRMPLSHYRGNRAIWVYKLCSTRMEADAFLAKTPSVYRGRALFKTGYVYAPYIPLMLSEAEAAKRDVMVAEYQRLKGAAADDVAMTEILKRVIGERYLEKAADCSEVNQGIFNEG